MFCSEKQKSVVRYPHPEPDLTLINFEQRKNKMGTKPFPEWKSRAPLFVGKLLPRAAVTEKGPRHVLAVRSHRCVLGPHLQVVGYQRFQGHECIPQLKDVLLALSSFRLSTIATPGVRNLIQPLNTEIRELLIVCVQHSIAI